MRRLLTSIRFQLVFVLLVFVLLTFFTISSTIAQYLRQNEITNESKRLSIIAQQIEERFERMYTAESLLRGYDFIPQKQKETYINVFLKPAVDNYLSVISTGFSDVEIGYYLPIFYEPYNIFSEKNALTRKIIVVKKVPDKFGGGYIFTAIPENYVEQGVNKLIQSVNRLVFYIALTTLFFILLITSFFSIRILEIRKGLKKLEKNLDFRFPNYGGEIGDIASSINLMAENLKKNLEEMQRSEALKSLGLFTSGIVHEVRNPLTSIKGFATLLSQRLQGREEMKYVLPILTETERLQHIVNDLLKYGRPTPLNLVNFNIRAFFNHIVELAKQYDTNKQINFIVECNDGYIVADERKLEEMFLNLVINAIQAIENTGTVRIKCFEESDLLIFEVEDTGIGMDKETVKNIFVPFYTTKEHGTGLGLAIVHRIVEEHGGEIFVESEKGKGTKFRIVLPKRNKDEDKKV